MKIRRFKESDAKKVSDLIINTLMTTNIKDYTKEYLEEFSEFMTVKKVLECGRENHFYVVEDNDKIIACGAIGINSNNKEESELHKLFVDPNYQGKSIGKELLEVLEKDEFALKTKRITGDSSLTAPIFYEKMGYEYEGGKKVKDEVDLCFHMVKYLK